MSGSVLRRAVTGVVPPTHRHRTLVLCFDGTGDQFDLDISNVAEFFTALNKSNPDDQQVYYQSGIGTYTAPNIVTPLASKISRVLDEGFAWNMHAHIMEGYEFLMHNYRAGDRICLFGFSRGAYTARCLAGMIHKVGLLPAHNRQQVPFAYKIYTRMDKAGWDQANAFKKAFANDVPVDFVGLWDAVGSVGFFWRHPYVTSNTFIRTFRHAVSLDEHRAKFKPDLWNRPNEEEEQLGAENQRPLEPGATDTEPTDVEEVWFAGCHRDVGGGAVKNGTPHSLSRIPLRWMIRECFKENTGIMFVSDRLRQIGIDPDSLSPQVIPRPQPLSTANSVIDPDSRSSSESQPGEEKSLGVSRVVSEEENELRDAMSPMHDKLVLNKAWWLLEVFPFKQRTQLGNNEWDIRRRWNLGEARVIPLQKVTKIKVHRSVKMRMDAHFADGKRYVPRASFEIAKNVGNLQWMD